MELKQALQTAASRPFLLQGRYGIEREGQRVTLEGQLAATDHPAVLGNRAFHPYIQTDFSETQLELITSVFETIPETLRFLEAAHDVAQRSLSKDEMLWPLSMPPALPLDEKDIKIAKLDQKEDVLYRRFLARTYGKRKQMVSGIHFNFEFSEALVRSLFEAQSAISALEQFKTELYMKLSRNFLHYRWVMTYLFGATPMSEAHYFTGTDAPNEPLRSIRSSRFGYTNHPDVQVSYSSLTRYLADIQHMVDIGRLSEEKEFYAPIRLRGGKKVADLAHTGIRYVELRNLDIDPFFRIGVSEDELSFIHLFLLYLLWLDEEQEADEWVASGDQLNDQVALENPLTKSSLAEAGKQFVDGLIDMLQKTELAEKIPLAEQYRTYFDHPELTPAGRLFQESQKSSQGAVATAIGKENYAHAWERPYQLAGYRGMELSTQILLFDAIQRGIEVEILDEQDQFLKLTFQQQVEYVKNANMTSKDTYIVPLIMANKTVTKKVLAKAGFRVPQGAEFTNLAEAAASYPLFAEKGIVIKPKSTNYGLGITIFQDGAAKEDYLAGLAIAFKEDEAVLVEEFLPGTEYRFFVIDGKVEAVMLRVPANVTGDGIHTVAELTRAKNTDPLRGTNHRAPLELIQLGSIEKLMLKEQGLTVDSIPETGRKVTLRENSNISTGGDSIDMTAAMPASYKQIAAEAVSALGAVICGIDLIIPDRTRAGAKDSKDYGIIEANFNPAMHMHIYSYSGEGPRLTQKVLDLLFPNSK